MIRVRSDESYTSKTPSLPFWYSRFTDMTAINQHMSSPLVTELHVTFKESNPPLLQPTTNIWTISWLTDALLSRNDRLPSQLPKTTTHDLRARIENPYIIFAIITDPDPRDIDALEPFGAAVVKYATESEPDTIFYADALPKIVADGSQAETEGLKTVEGGYICAWEVYASKQACLAHLQDESVKNLAIEGHKLGSKFTITPLIMKEGWLIRE